MSQQCKAEQKQEKISQILLSDLLEPSGDKKTVSLPLQFQFLPVELLSKEFTKLNNNHEYRIHYLGPRFHNTLTIHKKYGYTQKTPHQIASLLQERQPIDRYRVDTRKIIESYFVQQKLRVNTFYKSNLFYRAFEGMNPTLTLEKEYVFNSIFQSGNLDCVIKVKQTEFDLFLRIDSNTKGHVQWFYFSVRNGNRKEKIKLNICNLSKAKSLYESGLQPYIFSKERIRLHGGDWEQRGVNLGLSKKELRYDYLDQKIPNFNYYCLQLEYEFQHENDEVFFAYCVPYTFSKLNHELKKLPELHTHRSVLGKTLAGIDIPILHITNHQRTKQKKNILITGRMHPGEPNSSHMLQGFIQFLNSSAKEAVELRNRINFFIIPMVNPDGVIIGNTRTSAAGKDLNRQFLLANRDLYPEVALIKEFARKLHNLHGVFMYLDFHGHSRKKNTFFYGPAYTISEPNYYKCRILPKLIEKVNTNFRFHSCSFGIDEEKKQTARAIMFEHFKINFTYTIETSIGFFYDCQNLKTVNFNHDEWKKMGISIADGLCKFIIGFEEYEEILKERRASRQKKRPPTSNKYMLTEYKLEADEELGIFKRAEPLKIVYNDKSLFGAVIDELKTIKSNNYIKEIDDDCDSDAHDDREDFQVSKMKEFNNLLTDIAHREKPRNNHILARQPKTERHKIRSQSLQNLQNYEEELKFFEEMEALKKPSTTQGYRESVQNTANLKNTIRRELKNSMDIKKTQVYRTTILNNNINKEKKEKADIKILNRSLEKKMASECQLNNDKGNDKISYFGQYHLFVDKSQAEKSKVTANFQRNSLFRREKSKKSKRSGVNHIEESRFLSQSYLEKPGNKHLIYQNQTTQMNYHGGHSGSKPNNYEFKFDEIETALVAKEKLKDYLRTKINRSNRSNVIGPASFYGIRQNLNLKLSNKKKFFEEKSTHSNKESLKVIKFT